MKNFGCACSKMTGSHLLAALAGAGVSIGAALLVATGPEHDHAKDAKKAVDSAMHQPEDMSEMDMEQMVQMMQQMSAPAEQHEYLQKTVGTWDAVATFGMPGEEAPATKGRLESKSVLGGRFVQSEFTMDNFMGMEFHGMSLAGYDKMSGTYESVWADTMTTHITMLKGERSADGTMTMKGTSKSPMGEAGMKIVTTWDGDDSFTDNFYDQMPDGSWVQSGKIVYTRN